MFISTLIHDTLFLYHLAEAIIISELNLIQVLVLYIFLCITLIVHIYLTKRRTRKDAELLRSYHEQLKEYILKTKRLKEMIGYSTQWEDEDLEKIKRFDSVIELMNNHKNRTGA